MRCNKTLSLLAIISLQFLFVSSKSQVPLKIWDQVIGTKQQDANGNDMHSSNGPISYYGGGWQGDKGFKMVKAANGFALIMNNRSSNKSGNINTDENPGDKLTGIVVGFNNDGTKRFDKRFLASGPNSYVNHYALMNFETLTDIQANGNNLLIGGHMYSGTPAPWGSQTLFITNYQLDMDGNCIFAKRLFDPFAISGDVLLATSQAFINGGPLPQSNLFVSTQSSGGINLYLYDDNRTTPFNANCFAGNWSVGMIRRTNEYVWDETGISATNKANVMGDKGFDLPIKVLSRDNKYFSGNYDFLLAVGTEGGTNCFFSTSQKGKHDLLFLGIDQGFDKIAEFRLGGPPAINSYTYLNDFTFTKDHSLLIIPQYIGPLGGDFQSPLTDPKNVYLFKFNPQGGKIWEKQIRVGYVGAVKISPTNDNGFLILSRMNGVNNSYPPRNGNQPADYDLWIQKFDENANKVWEYRFGSALSEEDGIQTNGGPIAFLDLGDEEYVLACPTRYTNGRSIISGDRSKDSIGGPNDVWLLKFKNYPAQSIKITGSDKPLYIDGSDFEVKLKYTLPANYNFGNEFYVEVSDANGNFPGFNKYGPYARQFQGELSIPILQFPYGRIGNKYKVRILSTEPRDTSLTLDLNFATAACPGGTLYLNSSKTGNTFQWQVDDGSGFKNITNNSNYNGVNSIFLQITNVPSAWSDYKYRCVIDGTTASAPITIRVKNTWTGNVDNTWENPGNWECGQLPDVNSDVFIQSSGTTLTVNSNQTIKSLTLQPGAKIQVTPDFSLNITGK